MKKPFSKGTRFTFMQFFTYCLATILLSLTIIQVIKINQENHMNHLPADVQSIAAAQGWSEESIIIHLVGYIEGHKPDETLKDYMTKVAQEENED